MRRQAACPRESTRTAAANAARAWASDSARARSGAAPSEAASAPHGLESRALASEAESPWSMLHRGVPLGASRARDTGQAACQSHRVEPADAQLLMESWRPSRAGVQARDRGDRPTAAKCRGCAAEYREAQSRWSIKPNAGVADSHRQGLGAGAPQIRARPPVRDPREWLARCLAPGLGCRGEPEPAINSSGDPASRLPARDEQRLLDVFVT
jgi:hypothetical protein